MANARIYTRDEWNELSEQDRGQSRASQVMSYSDAWDGVMKNQLIPRILTIVAALIALALAALLAFGTPFEMHVAIALLCQIMVIVMGMASVPRRKKVKLQTDDYDRYVQLCKDTQHLVNVRYCRQQLLPVMAVLMAVTFIVLTPLMAL